MSDVTPALTDEPFVPPATCLLEPRESVALVSEDRTSLTYAELARTVRRAAMVIQASGVAPGDSVAVVSHVEADGIVAYWALSWLGATAVMIDPTSPADDVRYFLDVSGVKKVIVSATTDLTVRATIADLADVISLGHSHAIDDSSIETELGTPCEVLPSAPALVTFTSGTTGRPKAVLHTYGSMLAQHRAMQSTLAFRPDDRVLAMLPLHTIYGVATVAAAALFSGSTLVLMRRFHPVRALERLMTERITVTAGVPTMLTMMVNAADALAPVDTPEFDVILTSGAPIAPSDEQRFAALTGARVLHGFGMSECPVSAFERRGDSHVPGTAGRVSPGFEFATVDSDGRLLPEGAEGEIVLRGPTMMREYLGMPEETAARMHDGWIKSGDLGHVEGDLVRIIGRRSDIIIRGGLNVAPAEVEHVLSRHPGVAECAVVGVPDATFGQLIRAVVVPSGDAGGLVEKLLRHCRELLARGKTPDLIDIVDELPRNSNGKVVRSRL